MDGIGNSHLLGVDIGSSFIKASIFNTDGHACADARRPSQLAQPRAGIAEYDSRQLYRATCDAINEARELSGLAPADIVAICLDGMISGAMGVDGDGEPTTPYTTTLDMRFAPQLNYVLDNFHDLVRQKTGSGQPTIAPKMMWIRDEFPDVFKRTAKFVTIGAYIAGKLAGLAADTAFVDGTYLWASGLSDTPAYRWSDELCEALNLPIDKLPRIVQSSEIIGGVSREAAVATGLLPGTPVVAGAGDQSAGYVGAGLVKPNRMADAAGTFPILALCTDTFRPDLEHKLTEIMPSAIPGLWNPCSLIIGGGLTHQWFLETFAGSGAAVPMVVETAMPFSALDESARRVPPGSEKLVFIPHLGGRACPTRTTFRGMWIGFTWIHKREHFYRALLEAIAYDQYVAYQSLKTTYPEAHVAEIVVYGGGARSDLWNQIKADVMGLPYVALDRVDVSSLGAAILAGYAVGIFDDIAATADRMARRTRRVEPQPDAHTYYRQYAGYYAKLLDRAAPAYDALAALPEWESTDLRSPIPA